jgi:hypothetical protein
MEDSAAPRHPIALGFFLRCTREYLSAAEDAFNIERILVSTNCALDRSHAALWTGSERPAMNARDRGGEEMVQLSCQKNDASTNVFIN